MLDVHSLPDENLDAAHLQHHLCPGMNDPPPAPPSPRSWLDGMLKALADNPIVSWILLASVGIHLTLGAFGLHVYRCAFNSASSLPCPGCGISTGILCLLKGDWTGMWNAHPFSPYLVALGCVIFILTVLPRGRRHKILEVISRIERRTFFNAFMMAAFLVYGVARLLLRALAWG